MEEEIYLSDTIIKNDLLAEKNSNLFIEGEIENE